MKPNGSNQRSNLVARTWIPLTLMLLGVALVAPIDFRAAPDDDKDLAQQIFDTMVQLPGNKPGNRLVHAKGIVCQGTFAPSKHAAAVSQPRHLVGVNRGESIFKVAMIEVLAVLPRISFPHWDFFTSAERQ